MATIEYPCDNESTGRGYLALPESGRGPGVLLLHAWWGLTPTFERLAERLAAEGFTVLAPDLYGGPTADTIESAEALMKGRDDEAMHYRATGALAALQEHPAVSGDALGAVGFSMGAAWATALSAIRDALRAVVLFYGAGEGDFTAARAAYLGHFAVGDEWEEEEWINMMADAMRGAGRELTLHWYEGVRHWFFEENRPEYDAEAAALAWERTVAFLREQLAR